MKHSQKRFTLFLCSIVALWFLCIPVHAQGTEIYTVVPEDAPNKYTVKIQVGTGGSVVDEAGIKYNKDYTVSITDGDAFHLTLVPDTSYEVEKVTANEKVIPVKNNKIEITNVSQDMNIAVTWKKVESVDPAPDDPIEEVYTIVGKITENGNPAGGVYLELHSKPKTFITLEDGSFRFENVEPGSHTLTAYRNQKQVGLLAFTLTQEGVGVNIQKLPDGTFQLNVDKNVTTLELDIELKEDGTLELKEAVSVPETPVEPNDPTNPTDPSKPVEPSDPTEPVQKPTEDKSPDTGDTTNKAVWLSLLLLSGCGLVFGYRKYQYKHH